MKNMNEKIEMNFKYKSKDLMKTINNAYFNPNTTMLLNDEIVESMILNDGMFIKIENKHKIEDLNSVVLKFNYDFFDHKITLRVSEFKDLFLMEEVISSEHTYKPVHMLVDDYAQLNIKKDKQIVVNIKEISEDYISFNTLKKDEDTLLEILDDKIEVKISIKKQDIFFAIEPAINKISNGLMNYHSPLFFKDKKSADLFLELYLDSIKIKKSLNEKEIQVNNAINELLAVR